MLSWVVRTTHFHPTCFKQQIFPRPCLNCDIADYADLSDARKNQCNPEISIIKVQGGGVCNSQSGFPRSFPFAGDPKINSFCQLKFLPEKNPVSHYHQKSNRNYFHSIIIKKLRNTQVSYGNH